MKHILFGKKAILDAINNGIDIECIKCINIPKELGSYKSKCELVNSSFFNAFKDINHQNIIAYTKQTINHISLEQLINESNKKTSYHILMIDENQDPRNFGSIIRTAASFDIDAIIYKNKNQVPINELVIKASMGAVYAIKFVKISNLNQAIDKLKNNGFWIYATGLTNNAQPLIKTKFDDKSIVIIGNENKGVSDLTLKKSDFIIKIDMSNKVQSLNIAVATGIVLYQLYLHKK